MQVGRTELHNGSVLGNLSLAPMVMWSNSNGVVTNGNDITVSNGIIKFNPLHTSHKEQYTCQTSLVTSTITFGVKCHSPKYFISISTNHNKPLSPSPQHPSPPHPSLPHTMLVHHSTSPALFSSSHKWTLMSSLTPCGLDQKDRSPVVLLESHSPLVQCNHGPPVLGGP